ESQPFCKHALRACKKLSPLNSTSYVPMSSMAIIPASRPSSQANNQRTDYSIRSCLESKLPDNDNRCIYGLLDISVYHLISDVPAPHYQFANIPSSTETYKPYIDINSPFYLHPRTRTQRSTLY